MAGGRIAQAAAGWQGRAVRDLCRIGVVGLWLLSLPGAAEQVRQLPAPGSSAWQPVTFRSVERPTTYIPFGEPETGVRAEADCSASALVLPLEEIDLSRTPVLHWRWRILQGLDVEDERSRSGDDFAARVYVMFRFEPDRASLLERFRRGVGERLFGAEMPGTALSFVWSSRIASGAIWTNPYAAEARMIALASGPGSGWRAETVDLPASYASAFGHPPPQATGIGVMTDADDTCQQAVAEYQDFRLAPREPAGPGRNPEAAAPGGVSSPPG